MTDSDNNQKQTPLIPQAPRFRHSVHQIPTPGVENTRPPRYEPLVLNTWLIRGVSVFMIAIAIGLQIALYFSDTWNGFSVPRKNVFNFASTQFLTSFFPTIIAVPLAHYWISADWLIRWYQPYVTLSQRKVSASRSILLDYVALNPLSIFYTSWVYKHYLIAMSALIALSVILFQPLAGSLLQVRQVPYTYNSSARLMQTVGLSPTIDDLDGYLASTGFALASVYDNMADPPFVHGIWAAGQFQVPSQDSYLNGTIAVNTTAIQTEVNCVSPTSLNVTNQGGSYVASATFPNGCSGSNTFNPSNGTQQFNAFNAASCAPSGLDIKLQPVMFWFYLNTGNPQVASVYCNPTMEVFMVETSMNLTTGAMGPCTIIVPETGTNNVTGSPQNGRPYNGVIFDSNDDFYVSSRAQAISFAVPDAIYRYASQQPGGLSPVFQDQYGFLNATQLIYTQYLSVAAQINFFLASNSSIPAFLTAEYPRLLVEPLPTHILTALLILIGFAGLWLHVLHRRARNKLWLTSPPGSIASIVSMTSRSGFGQLLLPYDDERRMEDNLAGLEFYIDSRTGAIVAEDDLGVAENADGMALLGRERPFADSPPPIKRTDDMESP